MDCRSIARWNPAQCAPVRWCSPACRALIYAASDPKAGAAGSVLDLLQHPSLNHHVVVECGLLADEAAGLLRDFFRYLRAAGKK